MLPKVLALHDDLRCTPMNERALSVLDVDVKLDYRSLAAHMETMGMELRAVIYDRSTLAYTFGVLACAGLLQFLTKLYRARTRMLQLKAQKLVLLFSIRGTKK